MTCFGGTSVLGGMLATVTLTINLRIKGTHEIPIGTGVRIAHIGYNNMAVVEWNSGSM
jgi:hypothetical protein